MASFEERDVSSGGFCMEEAAWTLADELNKEYSVLKSSLGESIKAPPITGSCEERDNKIRLKTNICICFVSKSLQKTNHQRTCKITIALPAMVSYCRKASSKHSEEVMQRIRSPLMHRSEVTPCFT